MTRDALCCCKKSLFEKNLFARTEQADELQKLSVQTGIISTFISLSLQAVLFDNYYLLARRESPAVFISNFNECCLRKGSNFQTSPPDFGLIYVQYFLSIIDEKMFSVCIALHFFKVFPSSEHLAAPVILAGVKSPANWRGRERTSH